MGLIEDVTKLLEEDVTLSATEVSHKLDIPSHTLSRRLSEENSLFASLLLKEQLRQFELCMVTDFMSLDFIASRLGFSCRSLYNFSHKHFNLTPRQYRNKHRARYRARPYT